MPITMAMGNISYVLCAVAGGLLALGGVSLAGLAVPVNLYTVAVSVVLGIPGVAGLTALSFL